MSNMTDGSEGSEHRAAWNPLYGELNDPASSQLPVWANSYVSHLARKATGQRFIYFSE